MCIRDRLKHLHLVFGLHLLHFHLLLDLLALLLGLHLSLRGGGLPVVFRRRGLHLLDVVLDVGTEPETTGDRQQHRLRDLHRHDPLGHEGADPVEVLRQGVHQLGDVLLVLNSLRLDGRVRLDVDTVRALKVALEKVCLLYTSVPA